MAKKKQAAPAPAPPKAQGTGKKRTPQSSFDPAAGKDVYEPEKIVATRMAKGGVTQFQVKWASFDSKSNTWEPLEHLAGCEDMIADFKEREKQRLAELDAAATQKRIEKEEAAAKAADEAAAAATAARVAAQSGGNPTPQGICPLCAETNTQGKQEGARRTAPIWEGFSTTGCASGHAVCKLLKPTGEICGQLISIKTGPTGLWNHAMYHHQADYMRLKPPTAPLNLEVDPQTKLAALAPKHRDAIHKAIARWLVKRKRPLSLPEDSEFHDVSQMEFFRVQQRAVLLYDVNHARKAGDAYKEHQMGLEDWRINLEGVAVLQPIADWTQHMQGTKSYPTLPLVLPTVYGLIDGMGPTSPLTLDFAGQDAAYELEPNEMHNGVLEARTDMHSDWVDRWITNIDPEAKRTYAIATQLHPYYFKDYGFIEGFDLISQSDKAWALRELRSEWATVWKPRVRVAEAAPEPAAATAAVATAAVGAAATKKRKVTLGSLLGSRVKKETTTAEAEASPAQVVLDELEQYLADEEEFDLETPVLKWWQVKEAKWLILAKIVKQYFAAPASSAGVEPVFSAAGKMHGDLSKSAKDETLEASLFAAFNTD